MTVTGAPHGTSTGYKHWRCRCPECRAHNAQTSREYNTRRKQTSSDRLPFAPLAEYCRFSYRPPDEAADEHAGPVAWVQQAVGYRWGRHAIQKWERYGMSLGQADEAATEIGVNIEHIWLELRDTAA